MALKISSKRLDKLAGKQPESTPTPTKPESPRKTPTAEPRAAEPHSVTPDPVVAQAVKAAEASAAASARAAEGIQTTLQHLRETVLINSAPRPSDTARRPVRMVVVRDREGLIEYIDVVDQSSGMH